MSLERDLLVVRSTIDWRRFYSHTFLTMSGYLLLIQVVKGQY